VSHGGHVFVAQYYGNGLHRELFSPCIVHLFDMPSSTKFSEIFWRLNSQEDVSREVSTDFSFIAFVSYGNAY
jgi:hypothetical protein